MLYNEEGNEATVKYFHLGNNRNFLTLLEKKYYNYFFFFELNKMPNWRKIWKPLLKLVTGDFKRETYYNPLKIFFEMYFFS